MIIESGKPSETDAIAVSVTSWKRTKFVWFRSPELKDTSKHKSEKA